MASPRYNKEYPNNLHKYRVKKGFTVEALCEAAETNNNMISKLASGESPPLDHEGRVKSVVQRISDILDVPIEDLFPRHICRFDQYTAVTEDQLIDVLYSPATPATIHDVREFNRVLAASLSAKELHVIEARYYRGLSLRDAMVELNMSQEGVRQVEAKALRKLRHPKSGMQSFVDITTF